MVGMKWIGGGAVTRFRSFQSHSQCGSKFLQQPEKRSDWLQKGEIKTTVNFWPRRSSTAGTPRLSSGVVEQSPLSSCVYSTNPTGTEGRRRGRGGGEGTQRGRRERHRHEGEGGRKEKRTCMAQFKRVQKRHTICHWTAKLKMFYVLTSDHLITVVNISSQWIIFGYKRFVPSLHLYQLLMCYQTGQHGGWSDPDILAPQIKGCFPID